MATIIFDFDDTLFDNSKFKEDIKEVFRSFSVAEETIQNTYKQVRQNYNFENHIDAVLAENTHLVREEMLERFAEMEFSKYVLPDIFELLEKLKEEHDLYLLTSGEEKFQQRKLRDTGIGSLFENERICITQRGKVEVLKALDIMGSVYFVNDKANENELIAQNFPHFNILQVSREKPVSEVIKQI